MTSSSAMSGRPTRARPSPESLGGPRLASRHVITFRLDDEPHEALLGLGQRANLGPSAFSRRIVEAYIKAHAPTNKTTRNKTRNTRFTTR
jgi:hypothetical protein